MTTELANAIVTYGFDQLGLKEINAVTHAENLASQRVLYKIGFHDKGEVFWYNETLPLFKINYGEKA
ncbi:MAG: GNAT family N-acetyltransferase [Ferruginibacter sp.]